MVNPIPHDPDTLIRQAPWYLLGGVLLVCASRFLDGFGTASAVMAVSLGASGAVFRGWRSERGLWMLAGLFLLLFGAGYSLCIYGQLRDLWQGRGCPRWDVWVDVLIGTVLLGSQVRILGQIVRLNVKIRRQ
jgi:hypothetical protein